MPRPRIRWIVAAGLVAALTSADPARAAFQLEFDQANYIVQANASVTVSVFLRETTTTLLTTQGLIAGDLRVLFNESPRSSEPAQVTGRLPNPLFDSPAPVQPAIVPASAATSGVADIVQSSLSPVTTSGSDPGRVLLGRFVFQAGSSAGQETLLRATDLDPSADGFVLANNLTIDAQVQAGLATITVEGEVIPEPSSLTIVAIPAAMGLGMAARRRRGPSKGSRAA